MPTEKMQPICFACKVRLFIDFTYFVAIFPPYAKEAVMETQAILVHFLTPY